MSEKLVYLVLGSRGGGRAAVVVDLVDFGLESSTRSQVFVSQDDALAWGAPLSIRHELCEQTQYIWEGVEAGLVIEAMGEAVFIIADGLSDPSDFVEAFFYWLQSSSYKLGRIITIADCARINKERKLLQWYDCCIHFTDVILLANRQDVSNKRIEEFKDRYLKEYYPCLFVFVKKGRLPNPSLVLEPEARRISKLFDEADVIPFIDEEVEFEDSGDVADDADEEEEFEGGDPSKDPYLAKMVNGKRSRTLPDIRELLD